MKEVYVNNEEVIIRKAKKSDAKALIEYLNVIGEESDYLTFGVWQFARSVEQEEEFVVNA